MRIFTKQDSNCDWHKNILKCSPFKLKFLMNSLYFQVSKPFLGDFCLYDTVEVWTKIQSVVGRHIHVLGICVEIYCVHVVYLYFNDCKFLEKYCQYWREVPTLNEWDKNANIRYPLQEHLLAFMSWWLAYEYTGIVIGLVLIRYFHGLSYSNITLDHILHNLCSVSYFLLFVALQLQLFLGDYLDVRNTASSQIPSSTNFDEPTSDINAYFTKKKNTKPKKVSIAVSHIV